MFIELAIVLITLLVYYAFKLKRTCATYWQNQGVKVPPTSFPIGYHPLFTPNSGFATKSSMDYALEQYKATDGERFYGVYIFGKPQIVIKDPELVKQIFVKDFTKFSDRIDPSMNKALKHGSMTDYIWSKQLPTLTGDAWKEIRTTFSPIFTSGKMKAMMPFIYEVNNLLIKSFEENAESGKEFDMKEKFGKFSMDAIATCAFGLDAESFSNPKSEFVDNAKELLQINLMSAFKVILARYIFGSKLFKLMGMSMMKDSQTKFFYNIVKQTLNQRMETKERRNDLIDMMIDAMKSIKVEDNQDENQNQFDADAKLTFNGTKSTEVEATTIVSNALTLLIAGYDTTAQTLSYAGYELAKNPEIQQRLQDEIDQFFDENEGKMPDYQQIQSLEYLDMVFHETLRLHPALAILTRAATDNYIIPGTNVRVAKGDDVFFNVAGIHLDEKYYPNPMQFNPEHFSKEKKSQRHPYTFLAFGQGPRNCIGMRFAMLEAKIALSTLLRKYNFVKCGKTLDEFKLDPKSIVGSPIGGLWVKVEKRKH